MRLLPIVFALGCAASPASALAAEVDAATLDKVKLVAARGYEEPGKAEIRNVRKSKAVNGTGYCGEISIEDMAGSFTTFHVLLDPGSVLRLIDFNAPETEPNSKLVHELMQHFGCTR